MNNSNLTKEELRTKLRVLWEGTLCEGTRPELTLKQRTIPHPSTQGNRRRDALPQPDSGSDICTPCATFEADSPPRYDILHVLGRGGMGTVYAAQQTSVDRTIALKTIHPEASMDSEAASRFLSEARVTAELEHPNIVPVHDMGSSREGVRFYTMREVRGTEWSQVLSGMTKDENLDVLMRAADAVAFAHSKGIIHRDLKPANVMLGGYGEVLVIDWGLAIRRGGKAATPDRKEIGGTPCYMPPEMAKGEMAEIGPESDVYLLGAILYEIVTGMHPHRGEDAMACLEAAAANRIEPVENKDELVDIALRALETRPADRYPSVKDFQQAIRDYRRHAESIALVAGAEVSLAGAVAAQSYVGFTEAAVLFREAQSKWPGNRRAAAGAERVAQAHAEYAIAHDDLDLAESLLTELSPPELCERLAGAKLRRERQREEAERAGELDRQREEGWVPVCDMDFGRGDKLDPRFEVVFCPANVLHTKDRRIVAAPEAAWVNAGQGCLELTGTLMRGYGLTVLRWGEPVGENARIEIVMDSPTAGLSVAGDGFRGYRAVFNGYRKNVSLDTIGRNEQHVYQSVPLPDGAATAEHRLAVQKSGSSIDVWVDGVSAIHFLDPIPLSGPDHRTFGVSVYCVDLRIRRLTAFRCRSPEVVSVLDVGRQLLRSNHAEDALVFFQDQVATHGTTTIGLEAEILLAIALRQLGRMDDATARLERVRAALESGPGADENADRRQHIWQAVLTQMAGIRAEERDFERAVAYALLLRRQYPAEPAVDHVFNLMVDDFRIHVKGRLSTLSPHEQAQRLRILARLPVEHWNLSWLGLATLAGMAGAKASELLIIDNGVADLSPIADMPLECLECQCNNIADLTPLVGMPLKRLDCSTNPIANLWPLSGLHLELLVCLRCAIADLSPLADMPLKEFLCGANRITDLSPLSGMPLAKLVCSANVISDLAPLTGMPLEHLSCWENRIADLSPLSGLPLKVLECGDNRIADLSPLLGMQLEALACHSNAVTDLALLTGMPLKQLRCEGNRIVDLTPLSALPLESLSCGLNPIRDLSPLRGLPLTKLEVDGLPLTPENLATIRGLPLESFGCGHCQIDDLSVVAGMPLQELRCENNRIRDLAPLDEMPLTRLVCGSNRLPSLSTMKGLPLSYLKCDDNEITSIAPLATMPLNFVDCSRNRIEELTAFKDAPLETLICSYNSITDLAPLAAMPLTALACEHNRIRDLAPLDGMPLEEFACGSNLIRDLSPLASMRLRVLDVRGVPLTSRNAEIVQAMPLNDLRFDVRDESGVDVVRAMPALQRVNGLSPVRFLSVAGDVRRVLLGASVDLREHAAPCGAYRYLSVPQRMTKEEAEALCRAQKARLACLDSADKLEAVYACLDRVPAARLDQAATYFVSACVRPDGSGLRWASGRTVDTCWGPAAIVPDQTDRAADRLRTQVTCSFNSPAYPRFCVDFTDGCHYVLMEWDA